MKVHTISESIKELLAEQNHDATNITIDSIRNRIVALNNIVVQFVKAANQNEALSRELGVTNTEVLQLDRFAEYIARLNDFNIGFYTYLIDCKLMNKESMLNTLYEMQQTTSMSATYMNRAQVAEKQKIEFINRLINEINN
jgi:hypothetical protein